MEIINKKRAASLGIRVGIVFLIAVSAVIIVAYYVLSQNFQGLLTTYTIKLVEAMTDQSVSMVESELKSARQETIFLANSFQIPESGEETVQFPQPYSKDVYLRMVYVTKDEAVSSDGRQRDIRNRRDIQAAFAGKTEVYGPYFNEENEYVVCYSAPIIQGGDIVGVLSVEQDGYQFCEIIKNIRFVKSGESYIINSEGTDIAVSDPNHIDWVNSQYNARKLYESQPDEETKTIIELEQRGLNGETGLGTYYWNDGLCYVFYKPIPSEGWVLLAGLREEEIASMTQSAFFASVSDGPLLGICVFLVLFITAVNIYWVISSMKKGAEINEKLNIIANYDSLTGLLNRNSYHNALDMILMDTEHPLACIYIDVNGLHELNNHLGHQAGDKMLKAVADALRSEFPSDGIYRIGGDEFVVLCRDMSEQDIESAIKQIRRSLYDQSYEISAGLAWWRDNCNIINVIQEAETAMQQDKRQFYESSGKERRLREMNKKLEQMIMEKQDAETFLEVLAPEFKGVYFVNLSKDTIRHLYIPSYFEECLQETGDRFSKAILLYAKKIVKPQYYHDFEELCNYGDLVKKLNSNQTPELVYQKLNGDWLKLKILKFRDCMNEQKETLWIFVNTDVPDDI